MNTPWKIVEMAIPRHALGYRAIVDSDGDTICNPSPMGEANARLIAAAPELLTALQAIIDEAGPMMGLDDGPGSINRIARIARAAIAKATGA